MVLVLLVASVVALTQVRLQTDRALFARLERAERQAVARIAVRNRLRPLLAGILTGNAAPGTVPDGTPFEMQQDGHRFAVRLSDVGGLADLHFAPDALLAALPGGATLAGGRRQAQPATAAPLPVEEAVLARFGLGPADRQALTGLVTTSGAPGPMNEATILPLLRPAATGLGLLAALPVQKIRVGIEEVR